MPYKNFQDSVSDDDDDDELFSYLQTAHTVKHVKIEPIKTCDDYVTASHSQISTKISNKSDSHHMSSPYKSHRQPHQSVPCKRNVRHHKQSGKTWYNQKNNEDIVPEECRIDHSSRGIKDILSDIQFNNNKETNVHEFEILNSRTTDIKQNVKFYESPEIHIDIEKQASCDIKGLTQDFEHNTDGGAVVNSICTPENCNKAGNSNRGNDMPQSNAEHGSCQTEFSSLDNKYYLINERDWMSLFSSLQMNKQEYPLLSFDLPNTQICPTINDFTRNKDGHVNVTDAIPGQESSTDNSDTKNCLNDATVTERPVKQTSEFGPQNVEVVYVRIEDEKLKCDMNDSPVKNIVVRSPMRCNNTSNDIKHSEVVHSCNNNTILGDGNVLDRYSEYDFHGRFVRINNKLTRLFYLKDQSGIEKVQYKPVDSVEENTRIVDGHSESGCETAFFIDLDNWHETHGESDLKIFPISIQNDSYTFLQDSSSIEQYIAHPLNQNEECMIVDEPASELSELADSHALCMNQRLSSSQGSQHSDKIVSNKSPLKKITLSPCKLVRSPKKSICQIKTEVMKSSAGIIKNLWENFKSDDGRQRLPGATYSEDVVENSVNLSECASKKDACCIESDGSSDNENDMLLRYLRRSKMENAADASSSVYSYDESSSPIRSSLRVQTNICNNDYKFEPNKYVTKCMQSEIKKMAKSSEIHKCNDAILEKLDRDVDSDKIKAKCSGKERIRKDVNSKAEICSPSENKLEVALDNKGSLNCVKMKVKRKPRVDLPVNDGETEISDPRNKNGKTNVKKAKLSITEISSSMNDEKIQTSLERSQRIKASKQPSQSKNKVIKKSPVLRNISKKTLTVVSNVLDGEKTNDFDNGIGSVCNELDTFERERSDENSSGTGTSSYSLWESCERKNSRNEKKKLKTDTVESGNCNKYDEKTNDKDCTVSDKLKAKIDRKSAGCKLKKKKVMTDISKGQKNLNYFGRGIKVGKKVSDRNAQKVNNEKKVKRKVKSKKAVKTKLGVVCSSTELEDLNKWSKIKNSKVEFLEHLFHIKLKEAVEHDEKLPDQVACTENHAVKNPGYLETSIDFDNLEKDFNCGVPVICAEKVVGKVIHRKGQMNDVEIRDKIEDTTEPSTNINAATSVENIKSKKDNLISEQVNNVLHRTCDDLPKFESFKLDLMEKVNAVKNENEFKSDNDRVSTKKLKPDNLVPVTRSVDVNIMHTCSKIGSRTRRKPRYSKKKDIQMQLINTNQNSCKRQGSIKCHKKLHEVNTNPDSERRHQRIKSLKQLQSKSKAVNKRKTEVWKEKLQDEAFKFNFDKDLHKTYRPLNVKEMIRKILIPLSGSEGKKNAKDMKRHRKRKVQRITSKRGGHTSRHRVTSECDDAWFSDSGPSGSFPAFKFATTNHRTHTTVQSIEEKP